MHTELLHLIGAGGHGRVVLDALFCQGWGSDRIVVRDDRLELAGTRMLGCSVEVPVAVPTAVGWVHVAIGEGGLRERFLQQSGLPIRNWLTVCHPRSVIAASSSVAEGSFVAALAVVGPCAVLGKGVIINHGAIVDHDCQVSDFSHIGPKAALGGGVSIGRRVLVGAGATILPGMQVGDDAVIGAGSVVLADVPAGQTFVGVPGKNIFERKS